MTIAARTGNTGFSECKECYISFKTLEIVDIFTNIVYNLVNAGLEELPPKGFLDEAWPRGSGARCFGIGFQQGVEFHLGNCNRVILDDGSSDMVAVAQPVVGLNTQTFGFVNIANHRTA